MIRATLTAALVLALGGCFVPLSQGQAMENDLRILRDRLVAVEDRAETDDALLRERVAQAQRDAERMRSASRCACATRSLSSASSVSARSSTATKRSRKIRRSFSIA